MEERNKGIKLVQLSTRSCPHCPPATRYAEAQLEDDEYILVMLDSKELNYRAEDKTGIEDGVEKTLRDGGMPMGVPAFRIVDEDYNILSKPQGVQQAIAEFRGFQEEYGP